MRTHIFFKNIFRILHGSPFSLLNIISAALYGKRDIKMGHCIILAIWKIFFLLFVSIFHIEIFLFSSSILQSKPWNSLIFV